MNISQLVQDVLYGKESAIKALSYLLKDALKGFQKWQRKS